MLEQLGATVRSGPGIDGRLTAYGARAATLGRTVLVRSDVLGSDSPRSRYTLAHEAVHVLQQRHARGAPELEAPAASRSAEREADAGAPEILAGGMPSVTPDARPVLRFQPDGGIQPSEMCPGGCFTDDELRTAQDDGRDDEDAKIRAYFRDKHAQLRGAQDRYRLTEHSRQAFVVYADILSEIETCVRTGGAHPVDLNGLWGRARWFNWDWEHRAWMHLHGGERGFIDNGPFDSERILGVDVVAVFRAVISDRKPDPSLLERIIQELMQGAFLLAISWPTGGEGLAGVDAAALRSQRMALRTERAALRSERAVLHAERAMLHTETAAVAAEKTVALERRTVLKVRKIRPYNGKINVAGGLEKDSALYSNLNSLKPHTGGATTGIPNHVLGAFEDIAAYFVPDSATFVKSGRLRAVDVADWPKAARGTYEVLAPGGRAELNVWAHESEYEALVQVFRDAGFSHVKYIGYPPATIIYAVK